MPLTEDQKRAMLKQAQFVVELALLDQFIEGTISAELLLRELVVAARSATLEEIPAEMFEEGPAPGVITEPPTGESPET